MKKYIQTILVDAKIFEKSDADGFISRYYDDSDVNEDGSISTSGIFGEHEIKVPYVIGLGGTRYMGHGDGRDYLVVDSDGNKSLVSKQDFENLFKEA